MTKPRDIGPGPRDHTEDGREVKAMLETCVVFTSSHELSLCFQRLGWLVTPATKECREVEQLRKFGLNMHLQRVYYGFVLLRNERRMRDSRPYSSVEKAATRRLGA
ncbi:uncharacterized protein SEPMUDRAFT_134745 [Sphaerulina musiva SO2202]|uniref:Uncharacterized protein n=1 Tax=Sphaerulina musiva (strain SO2202) TaxID=692275 RepID=N1QGS8_SPHMS|nr:uncharacterized protein SEPMUDRAFT_134745 [Sphaerulina musiva SO2202]EMF10353.1 hypothetical protein SEPMUDRAFT_134745 [Sphaerulina musiva SO2202]